jgi:hypothetical protein
MLPNHEHNKTYEEPLASTLIQMTSQLFSMLSVLGQDTTDHVTLPTIPHVIQAIGGELCV